jgi:MerR family transcriptional regulator, thiopeptide resistance regulator
MSKKQRATFTRHSDEQQKQYERELRLEHGPAGINESVQRWNSYSKQRQDEILAEGGQVYNQLIDAIEADVSPQSAEIQALMERWHQNLRHFYEPTLEIMRGLGEMYNTHPDFIANFKKLHPRLGEYVREAINQYVDDLETAEIARMLAEDEALKRLSR